MIQFQSAPPRGGRRSAAECAASALTAPAGRSAAACGTDGATGMAGSDSGGGQIFIVLFRCRGLRGYIRPPCSTRKPAGDRDIRQGQWRGSLRYAVTPMPTTSPVYGPALLDLEPNGAPWFRRRGHELADGVEDDLELGVVFLLEIVKAVGKIGVVGQGPAKPDKRTNHKHAHVHRLGAAQNVRGHEGAVFRERIRREPGISVLLGTGHNL